MIEQKIETLLASKFEEEDFNDCFLVDLSIGANNKVVVFIDSDSSFTFARCQKISRYLESFIDKEGWLGEKYTLQVSSPGTSRPLKFLRQYKKNIGRIVTVTLHDGTETKGTLTSAEEESIVIEYEVKIKEGKKKRIEIIQADFQLKDIKKTIVKVKF